MSSSTPSLREIRAAVSIARAVPHNTLTDLQAARVILIARESLGRYTARRHMVPTERVSVLVDGAWVTMPCR